MFQLINPSHQEEITKLIDKISKASIREIATKLEALIDLIRSDIPQKKRISYGRYSIIKKLGLMLFPMLEEREVDVMQFAIEIFQEKEHDEFVRSLAVQLISIYGFKTGDLTKVLTVFEQAATDDHWEMRECSAGFIRKLIPEYTEKMQKWYLQQVKSDNPMLRRFASESLRPVADNKWFKKHPEFAFSVIENLYTESKPYPRTSVGNSLSDWARIDKEKVLKIVEKLVRSGDNNSYWIAYRACRNLVKKEPIRVMNLLNVDVYQYKKRFHYRRNYMN